MPNRLADENSPYLLQHKDNPVDWHPWGDEALSKARREDKPIFLSIGYATCHWCHVMERESFEDEEAARVLNEHTVPVKVDREERPDLDGIYMRVCQMMTGRGGWPLSLFLTPEGKPFHAATYLPKTSRRGQWGLIDLTERLHEAWENERERVNEAAEEVASSLQEAAETPGGSDAVGEDALREAERQLRDRFDEERGGFGDAPKFPTPHHLLFLLRRAHRNRHRTDNDDEALRMAATRTLDAMRLGGVYDHVGYGFHRYSTDADWLLPHFEKMLYDQALLALAYLEAHEATGAERYAETAREILTYVLRDMTAPEGGFYSAEDADSEGEEGAFYVWTTGEVREVLDDEHAEAFLEAYNFREEGNYVEESTRERTGKNIPHLTKPLSELDDEHDGAFREKLEEARRQLFARREERERPARDDKILTDWNGLMLAAFARAGRVLDDSKYVDAAERAAGFLLDTMRGDQDDSANDRLLHRYRDGEAGLPANLDDYAFFVFGLTELYETTFEADYLREALELCDEATEKCWDDNEGGFFFTPKDGEALIARQKKLQDSALPSGNSIMLWNLVRLARLTGRPALDERAERLSAFAAPQVERVPSGFTGLLLGADLAHAPSREVVIAGPPDADDTRAMLDALNEEYLPHAARLFRPTGPGAPPPICEIAPFTREQTAQDGRAAAYVCTDHACQAPTTDPGEMVADLVRDTRSSP
jgi:uncharacterized protein YyaL (SSP411 family)